MSEAYNPKNVGIAKILRKHMTKQEKRLWYGYLAKYPVRFQRQKPIGEYVADFYCFAAKLVVELDGERHLDEKNVIKDAERTAYMNSVGIKVIRFMNHAVDCNFIGVCSMIDQAVKERLKELGKFDAASEEAGGAIRDTLK